MSPSPLARSLLALTTLLAAADANYGVVKCTSKLFGYTTKNSVEFPSEEIPPTGRRIYIYDACHRRGTVAVGEYVRVCNHNMGGEAPVISTVNPGRFSTLDVKCSDSDSCLVDVMQFCADAVFSFDGSHKLFKAFNIYQ